jgi:hemolysin activation/secretion protein
LPAGLALSASLSLSESPEPDSDFARLFDYQTKARTFKTGLSYPLIRSRDLNFNLGLFYEHRDSFSDLLGSRFTADRLRKVSLEADLDFSDELGGVSQAALSLSKGIKAFGATDFDPGSSNALAGASYLLANLYISRVQSLPLGFSLMASAELQLSDSVLSSYNSFSYGGGRFGRGYGPGELDGDNGLAWALEARWTWRPSQLTAFEPFAFIDWGKTWPAKGGAAVNPGLDEMASAGLGIRLRGHAGPESFPDFNLSCHLGTPLKPNRDNRRPSRLAFLAAFYF